MLFKKSFVLTLALYSCVASTCFAMEKEYDSLAIVGKFTNPAQVVKDNFSDYNQTVNRAKGRVSRYDQTGSVSGLFYSHKGGENAYQYR